MGDRSTSIGQFRSTGDGVDASSSEVSSDIMSVQRAGAARWASLNAMHSEITSDASSRKRTR